MEEKEGLNGSGVTVKCDEGPLSFVVESRVENSGQHGGSETQPQPTAPVSAEVAPVSVAAPTTEVKKKRGRPRKYAGDGSIVALSPMPISASIPLTSDYSSWKQNTPRSAEPVKKKHKPIEIATAGGVAGPMAYSVGASFTPHVITVNAGEDVSMKIISFSQQGSRAICILAANGSISNVTLRQPNSSGGTLTYEGRFEILSLTGSFMPNDDGLTKSRSGGMSVSLAGPDGHVLGGGLAGMLVAAGPVQVVIGSFLPGHQQEQKKPKKQKYEHTIAFAPIPANPISENRYEVTYAIPKPNFATSASFHGDNSTSTSMHGSENIIQFHGEESRERNHEITC